MVRANTSFRLSVLAISACTKASLGAKAPRDSAVLGKGPCSMTASNSIMPAGMASMLLSFFTSDRP
ncbi:hypothetical protein D3C81_1788470 [compost metagenome]